MMTREPDKTLSMSSHDTIQTESEQQMYFWPELSDDLMTSVHDWIITIRSLQEENLNIRSKVKQFAGALYIQCTYRTEDRRRLVKEVVILCVPNS